MIVFAIMPEKRPNQLQRDIVFCQKLVEGGNVNLLNLSLAGRTVKIPDDQKLELLAQAYDRKAEIHDAQVKTARPSVARAYLVTTWELDGVAAKAIAANLRQRAQDLKNNTK